MVYCVYGYFCGADDDVAERARRARDDAAEDAKLDSGRRGLFFSVMVFVCLSVYLRTQVLHKLLPSARSVTSAESGAIEARRLPGRRAKSRGEFSGGVGAKILRRNGVDRPLRPCWSAGEGRPSPRISTHGAEQRVDQRAKAVHNRGEDSSPRFCTVFLGGEHVHRRADRRWTPGEAGALSALRNPARRDSPIPECKASKMTEETLLHRLDRRLSDSSHPSPSLLAMDTRRGGCPLAFSHRSTGRFADPQAPSV